ncbi:hypothetical protein COI55_19265 [Bacillus wiedmannii]|nr:hypothetical protein [Bacillus wiedmannii]PHD98791.1 hypothetical protein COF56_23825 [Bacillus wiedmannii]PHG66177.1 hypothetical protein COI55_19265 [Bacillus wiedmannii]
MPKLTYEHVKSVFEDRGYILLEQIYINNSTPMNYLCPKHSDVVQQIRYNNLKTGYGCRFCGKERTAEKLRVPLEKIRMVFQNNGYKLLDTEYKDCDQPLRYQCPKHPDKEVKMSYSNAKRGHGCPYCANEKGKRYFKKEYNEVKQAFEEQGYILLEQTYQHCHQPLKYQCPKHPDKELKLAYSMLKVGQRCFYCSVESRSGVNHYNWNGQSELTRYLRDRISSWRYEVFEKYNYKCFITGKSGNLQAHHVKPFHEIRDEVLKELGLKNSKKENYTPEQLQMICKLFEKKNANNEGIAMEKKVHKLFHRIYGNKTNITQLYEFKVRYEIGEFDKELSC